MPPPCNSCIAAPPVPRTVEYMNYMPQQNTDDYYGPEGPTVGSTDLHRLSVSDHTPYE
jgi:hypothetical protein